MKSMEFNKIVADIDIRTEIIKSIEAQGIVTFMSNQTSHSVKFTKEDLGESVFNAIIDCMKRVRAKQIEVQNLILLDEDTEDVMPVAEKALSQTMHNSSPLKAGRVEAVGINLMEKEAGDPDRLFKKLG